MKLKVPTLAIVIEGQGAIALLHLEVIMLKMRSMLYLCNYFVERSKMLDAAKAMKLSAKDLLN